VAEVLGVYGSSSGGVSPDSDVGESIWWSGEVAANAASLLGFELLPAVVMLAMTAPKRQRQLRGQGAATRLQSRSWSGSDDRTGGGVTRMDETTALLRGPPPPLLLPASAVADSEDRDTIAKRQSRGGNVAVSSNRVLYNFYLTGQANSSQVTPVLSAVSATTTRASSIVDATVHLHDNVGRLGRKNDEL
jgi:hypothetical protein